MFVEVSSKLIIYYNVCLKSGKLCGIHFAIKLYPRPEASSFITSQFMSIAERDKEIPCCPIASIRFSSRDVVDFKEEEAAIRERKSQVIVLCMKS